MSMIYHTIVSANIHELGPMAVQAPDGLQQCILGKRKKKNKQARIIQGILHHTILLMDVISGQKLVCQSSGRTT